MADISPKIDETELRRRLMDPSVPDSDIAPYVMIDPRSGGGFAPDIIPNPATVTPSAEEGAVLLSSLNRIARWRRDVRYRRKLTNWTGPKLVSEGDSWFQFPFLLQDVIDQLDAHYAIRSLGAAGDLVADIAAQDELVATVAAEQPDGVLLSGGGNDLLGDGRLARALFPFDPAFQVEDYITPAFETMLTDVLTLYRDLLHRLVRSFPGLPIVIHGYDHAIANRGRWLGRPMETLGILDPGLQNAIVAHLVDRFYVSLTALVAEPGLAQQITLIDCRGIVQGDWHDELHPTDGGFARVADKFHHALSARQPGPFEAMHEGLVAARPVQSTGLGAAALAATQMAATMSDEALEAEIGRRAILAAADPERAVPVTAEMSSMALEGTGEVFRKAGKRIVDRLHRELHDFLCGDGADDAQDREKLRNALGLDDAAVAAALVQVLISSFGLLPAVAAVVAALLLKRVIRPSLEEVCEVWGENFEPQP